MSDTHAADAGTRNSATLKRGKRRRRGSELPDDVVNAAFEMARAASLATLSMPALARYMDVPLTSIYWHFRKKEHLLDAMLDRAIRDYHFVCPFDEAQAWDEGLRSHFRKMREVFAENRVLCELVLMRPGLLKPDATRVALRNLEHVIQTMVDAGFAKESALEVYLALSVHSRGSAIIEHLTKQLDNPLSEEPTHAVGGLDSRVVEHIVTSRIDATGVTSGETPLLHELADRGQSVTDINFEVTLTAILEHAERLLARDRARAGKKVIKLGP